MGTPLIVTALRSPHNSRVSSESGTSSDEYQQPESNHATIRRSASLSTVATEAQGSVTFVSSNHSESETIVSPPKKRETRHASGQSVPSRADSCERDSTCECGRTTPTPLQRPATTFAPPLSSSLPNQPLSRYPVGKEASSNLEHREENTDAGMVPPRYRVSMCRGEPHLLMPVSKFRETKNLGSSDPVTVANNSPSTHGLHQF
ncbi:hypothetical protein QBC36DRAFT_379018 [Triangularia setosa]|uniref:Uncharacterized protein n=1 Tax=Triangularia setosa TaxID=2587417 RepID=A0AAN6W800_9PEZI|nr:hypothetical protein QBC36DRAFT_379018 [Podospora setosa]